MFFSFIKEVFSALALLALLTSPIWLESVAAQFNKAESVVYVDGNVVYEGPNHYVTVKSSQYNASKEVRIYKDINKLFLVKRYISNDVKVDSK